VGKWFVTNEAATRTSADFFRELGEVSAQAKAHSDRLDRIERSQQTYIDRQQQLLIHLASVARLCESNAEAITRLERAQEEGRGELVAALRALPGANRGSSIMMMVIGSLALAALLLSIVYSKGFPV
jgi:hypothetical protein